MLCSLPRRITRLLLLFTALSLTSGMLPAAVVAQPSDPTNLTDQEQPPSPSSDTLPISRPPPQPNITPVSTTADAPIPPSEAGPGASIAPAAHTRASLPLSFVPNAGQVDGRVHFLTRSLGGTVFFTSDEVVLSLPGVRHERPAQAAAPLSPPRSLSVLRLRFHGANHTPAVAGTDPLSGTVNYVLGADPTNWRTHLPTYAGLTYQELYPGIDLHYTGAADKLKSTYEVAPGADPTLIRWGYQGAVKTALDAEGNLHITIPRANETVTATTTLTQTLVEHAPLAWQDIGDRRVPVTVRYSLQPSGRVGFVLGAYDRSLPLTIDPTLAFSTYVGGAGQDYAEGIAVGPDGASYITGYTNSPTFPGPGANIRPFGGSYDGFVAKLNPTGTTLVYQTYLGGTATDAGRAIAVDAQGQAYVTGQAENGFPTTPDAYRTAVIDRSAFVVKLNADGTLRYSTTLSYGGTSEGWAIAIDAQGVVAVGGPLTTPYFPVTANAYDSTLNNRDGFVVKLNPSVAGAPGLLYSSFLGGWADDQVDGLALDANGRIYLTGYTKSPNFPTTATAYDTLCGTGNTCNNDRADVFVATVDPAQSGAQSLVYGTFLGGQSDDFGQEIAVDTSGAIYVTGWTNSYPGTSGPGFPTTPGAYDTVPPTGNSHEDAFVTKLDPSDGTLVYSTWLGGGAMDKAFALALDPSGIVVVAGETRSGDFPIVGTLHPLRYIDAFITTLDANGRVVLASTFLGGQGFDHATDVALGAVGQIVAAGYAESPNFPTTSGAYNPTYAEGQAFVTTLTRAGLPADQNRAKGEGADCGCQIFTQDPVNTRTGNFWLGATDLAIETPGPPLVWSRDYSSQAISDTSGVMGAGWQHAYAARLILPGMPGGEAGRLIVLSGRGNRLRFAEVGNGLYQAFPGVTSILWHQDNTYVQRLPDLTHFVFDGTSGRLLRLLDPQGRQVDLTYDSSTPPRLTQVADSSDQQRKLLLTYDTAGYLHTVSDGSRTITYTIDLNGDLTAVRDLMNRPTSYSYTQHLLTQVTNALGQPVAQMTYDQYTVSGKVTSQLWQDGRQQAFVYEPTRTLVTTTGLDGSAEVLEYRYSGENTLTGIRNLTNPSQAEALQASAYDDGFQPALVSDGNGQATAMSYTPAGRPLLHTNALGQTSRAEYDQYSRLTATTDALGIRTEYLYDGTSNRLISITSGITTTSTLRATTTYSYNGDKLVQVETPEGKTHYSYDDPRFPRAPTKVIEGYENGIYNGAYPDQDVSTTYTYDDLGRRVSTTIAANTPLARTDTTFYNTDNTIAQTIQNYQDGQFDPHHPDQDIITTYGYDALGRQAWVRDALGRYDVAHYNAAGQVDWTARNLAPPQFDQYGQPLYQAYSPTQPDANVATHYGYDGLGRTILLTETGILSGTFNTATLHFSQATTRVTRTEYDYNSRPVTTTLNYRPDLPVGTFADVNMQMLTRYDGAGNVIWERDTLGRWTRIEYDALNRPITTTLNYENGDPHTTALGLFDAWTDADLISVNHYDTLSRLERQIDLYDDGIVPPSGGEADFDRITQYQYDTLGRPTNTTRNVLLGSNNTAFNRSTASAYDPTTLRLLGQRDPLGRWVSYRYDGRGRVTEAIQNCTTAASGGQPDPQNCAAFSSSVPDRNVRLQTRYDALGRPTETIDPLGTLHSYSYDGLGRTIAGTQNTVGGQPANHEHNVTSHTAYDALGRTTIVTDALGLATHTEYNALGQVSSMTDAEGRSTTFGYDGQGTLRYTRRHDGQLTVYLTDGLGRVVTTILNYQDGVALPGEWDRDLISHTLYDWAGRRSRTTDPLGRYTIFTYDAVDNLTGVVENVLYYGSSCQQPCNVVTEYRYDRAGNRVLIRDARANERHFAYDAADQMIAATDALSQTTFWEYDQGGRVTAQRDPRGSGYDLTYSYDGLDRLTSTTASQLGIISAQYNGAGQRVSLLDGTGTTSFGYDGLGRLTSVQAPNSGTVGYGYDARGQRTQLTYPNGMVVDYQYWGDGQLKRVRQNGSTLADYTYDTAGRLQSVTRANGTVTTYGYDDADRLLDLHTTQGSTTVSRFQYTVNQLGLRTNVIETLGMTPLPQTRSIAYDYDGLLRLTGAVESPGLSYDYSYDRSGNRTEVRVNGLVTESRSYNAANQVVGWTYDAAGNLLSDGTSSYTYDALNRMTAATQSGQTRTNAYNGDGVLVAQSANGLTTSYVQDQASPLAQVLQTTQNISTTSYLYGLERLAAVSPLGRTWYGSDGLGSVRQTLSDTGLPLSSVNYDPWGTPESGSVPPTFGFTGELHDSATGLVNLRARWYHSGRGTFTSRDPFAGFPEQPYSLHPYQYGYSNPVLYTDPTGKCVPEWVPFYGEDGCTLSEGIFKGRIDTEAGNKALQAIAEPIVSAAQEIYEYRKPEKWVDATINNAKSLLLPPGLTQSVGMAQEALDIGSDIFSGDPYQALRGLSKIELNLLPVKFGLRNFAPSRSLFKGGQIAEMCWYSAPRIAKWRWLPSKVPDGIRFKQRLFGTFEPMARRFGKMSPEHVAVRNLDGSITDRTIIWNIERANGGKLPPDLEKYRRYDTFDRKTYNDLLDRWQDIFKRTPSNKPVGSYDNPPSDWVSPEDMDWSQYE